MKKLSIKEAFASAWKVFTGHVWVFMGSTVIIAGVSFIIDGLTKDAPQGVEDFVFSFVGAVLLWWLYIGFIRIAMTAYAGGTVSFDMLFGEKMRTLWHYVLAVLLSAVTVLVGFILLIVPGIVLQVGLLFVPFLILDKDMQPVASLKESWRLTKGYKWNLFGFLLLLILFNIGGLILAAVGLLVTAPLSLLVVTYLYREIEKGVQLEPVAPAQVPAESAH